MQIIFEIYNSFKSFNSDIKFEIQEIFFNFCQLPID
jgi:hypothetical protein